MSVISIIGLILTVIRYIPTAIGIVKEIIALIHQIAGSRSDVDKQALLTEFKEAIFAARQTKSGAPLTAFHEKLGKLLEGNDLDELRKAEGTA